MDDWKYVGRITENNLKMIFRSPRLYIVLIAVCSCIRFFIDGLPGYLAREGLKIGVFELLPVLLNSRLPQLVIYLGWVLLVSEIPFFSSNQTNMLIRTNRKAVLEGCTVYILLLALVYLLFLQIGSMCMLGFRFAMLFTKWSDPFTMAAKFGANTIGIKTSLLFDYGIVQNCTPIQAWGIQMVTALFLFVAVGMILFCGMLLREWFFIGHVIAIGLWAWDFLIVEFLMEERLLWISPVSMAKLGNLSFGDMARGPSVIYVLLSFLVMIILLIATGLRQIAGYDFIKE